MRLARRLEAAAAALALGTPAIAARFDEDHLREKIADADFTAEGALAKPVLIFTAEDTGRVGPSGSPIRSFSLGLRARMNAKLEEGKAEAGDAIAEAIEAWLDGTNLAAALTAASPGGDLHVFVAARLPGVMIGYQGLLRLHDYTLSVKAVGTEHTA